MPNPLEDLLKSATLGRSSALGTPAATEPVYAGVGPTGWSTGQSSAFGAPPRLSDVGEGRIPANAPPAGPGVSLGASSAFGAPPRVTTGEAARLPANIVQAGAATMAGQLAAPQPQAPQASQAPGVQSAGFNPLSAMAQLLPEEAPLRRWMTPRPNTTPVPYSEEAPMAAGKTSQLSNVMPYPEDSPMAPGTKSALQAPAAAAPAIEKPAPAPTAPGAKPPRSARAARPGAAPQASAPAVDLTALQAELAANPVAMVLSGPAQAGPDGSIYTQRVIYKDGSSTYHANNELPEVAQQYYALTSRMQAAAPKNPIETIRGLERATAQFDPKATQYVETPNDALAAGKREEFLGTKTMANLAEAYHPGGGAKAVESMAGTKDKLEAAKYAADAEKAARLGAAGIEAAARTKVGDWEAHKPIAIPGPTRTTNPLTGEIYDQKQPGVMTYKDNAWTLSPAPGGNAGGVDPAKAAEVKKRYQAGTINRQQAEQELRNLGMKD